VAGLFTLTPFLGGRLTYYNRQVVGLRNQQGVTVEETITDDRLRRQVEWGVETESRAARVYPLDGRYGVAALQHVIEPRAMITEIRGVNQKALPQWDPGARGAASGLDPGFYGRAGIDDIGKVNEITYSLTNRLNAKTTAGANEEAVRWELARFALSQTYTMLPTDEPFKDLYGDLVLQPSHVLQLRANAAYNMYGLGFRQANTDLRLALRDVSAGVGSRYDAVSGANFVAGEVSARVLRDVDVHLGTNWDVRDGVGVENRIGVDWRFQCFAILMEYVYRRNNESEFRFAVSLLGLGQVGSRVGN
jgi:hypothetical protein